MEKTDVEINPVEAIEEGFRESGVIAVRAGNELNLRCQYCMDSVKSKYSKHLYVGKNSEGLAVYYCQRCNARGLVGMNFLILHNVNRSLIPRILKQMPRAAKREKEEVKIDKLLLKTALPNQKLCYDAKLEYFKKRTGIDPLLDNNWRKYKLVVSLKKILEINADFIKKELPNLKLYDSFIDMLDRHYLGFFTNSNERIIFRRITNDDKLKRFFSLSLKEGYRTEFFAFKQEIPENNIIVTLSEGMFDSIGLSQRLDNKNRLFAAVLNKDYASKIEYFIRRFGARISHFEVYLDQDHIAFKQFPSGDMFKLFKNAIGKDYGEISERVIFDRVIKENSRFIKQ